MIKKSVLGISIRFYFDVFEILDKLLIIGTVATSMQCWSHKYGMLVHLVHRALVTGELEINVEHFIRSIFSSPPNGAPSHFRSI